MSKNYKQKKEKMEVAPQDEQTAYVKYQGSDASQEPAPTQAIAPTQSAGLATANMPMGFEEEVDQEDLVIPRAKLMQAMSPEIEEEGSVLRPGMIVNSLTKETLAAEFIPVFMYKNFIKFNPKSSNDPNFDGNYEPGAVIWRTNDAKDPRVAECKFGDNDEKPTATQFMNFFCHFPGSMPLIVSFSKTSYKAGKNLYTLAKMLGGDMFSRKYKLVSKKVMNKEIGTNYYVLDIQPVGKASDEEYQRGLELFKQFGKRAKEIKVHDETDTPDWVK